ncbi:hypothetical protein L228DRAFT_41244 [Xylona heveae TC161]|uniref:Large ribosomal subunit protein mL40 n=1 Tax=Xylona heveae (strain CBS 132557 / TC161) TaxID=1328760 RepID=A0A165A111_XYLHT|nr:hypothetical protein L228DRAFT_41244 [Xylona heveae TC161]KZF19803.1 hypothetical protein L228DRAFT_41244 [Xylona heveae TC161]
MNVLSSFRSLFRPSPSITSSSSSSTIFSSLWKPSSPSSSILTRHAAAPFSSTPRAMARDKGRPRTDKRITLIRYHLMHPMTPRPLRFSRLRSLRHWTIHRAWLLYRRQQLQAKERSLERQYNSMRDACEELRAHSGPEGARLFRASQSKKGIWQGVPVEYARLQTDGPPRDGFNEGWTR